MERVSYGRAPSMWRRRRAINHPAAPHLWPSRQAHVLQHEHTGTDANAAGLARGFLRRVCNFVPVRVGGGRHSGAVNAERRRRHVKYRYAKKNSQRGQGWARPAAVKRGGEIQ